jgi:hypothetical protein
MRKREGDAINLSLKTRRRVRQKPNNDDVVVVVLLLERHGILENCVKHVMNYLRVSDVRCHVQLPRQLSQ